MVRIVAVALPGWHWIVQSRAHVLPARVSGGAHRTCGQRNSTEGRIAFITFVSTSLTSGESICLSMDLSTPHVHNYYLGQETQIPRTPLFTTLQYVDNPSAQHQRDHPPTRDKNSVVNALMCPVHAGGRDPESTLQAADGLPPAAHFRTCRSKECIKL